MTTPAMKKSQSIKSLNERLLQFAIEDCQDILVPNRQRDPKRSASSHDPFIRTSTTTAPLLLPAPK